MEQAAELMRQMQDEDMRHTEELRKDLYAANDVYITALSRFDEAKSDLNDAEDKYAAIYAGLYGTPKQQEKDNGPNYLMEERDAHQDGTR